MKKKMKIIDLLCLISNGEEAPKKIIYRNMPMIYDNGTEDYIPHQTDKFHGNDLFHYLFEEETKIFLNDEVEILDDEEDNPKTLKFGDEIILTRTNCDDIQGFIISAKGIEPIEDKDIPLIPDDELYDMSNVENYKSYEKLAYNFKVLQEKINQVVEEFNNHIKENK